MTSLQEILEHPRFYHHHHSHYPLSSGGMDVPVVIQYAQPIYSGGGDELIAWRDFDDRGSSSRVLIAFAIIALIITAIAILILICKYCYEGWWYSSSSSHSKSSSPYCNLTGYRCVI
jgi:hypothetical protein